MECDPLSPSGGINEMWTSAASESMPCGSFRSQFHDTELREWMRVIHKGIQDIQMSTASQSAMIGDLQSSVKALSADTSQSHGLAPVGSAVPAPAAPESAEPASVAPPPPPAEMPAKLCPETDNLRLFPVTPGQVNEGEVFPEIAPSEVEKHKNSDPNRRRASRASKASKKSGHSGWSSKGKLPSNFQELEDQQASQLLGSFRPGRRGSMLSLIPSPGVEAQVSFPIPDQKQTAVTLNSKTGGAEKARVLSSTGRMSMEQLRMKYDEAVTTRNSTKESGDKVLECQKSSIPCLGKFLLCLVGHREFGSNLVSRCFSFFSYALLPIACTILLMYTVEVESTWNLAMILTLSCFQLGLSAASYGLKSNGLDQLLGPKAYQLDDYATDADFMREWQRLSRRRLMETLGIQVLLVPLVAVATFALEESIVVSPSSVTVQAATFEVAFWLMILRYFMLCYSVLHISCGFELAIDSFTLNFFKNMDIEEALEEWNILQATLRQVSGKLGSSLRAMGLCCLACVVLLAEQVIFNTDEALARIFQWGFRFYPLVIFFLYIMVRAASVTEKACRVAPLVNSWKFDEEEEESGLSMDHGRQYAVQYIMQSRAGFYLSGAQLTFPNVQKICYYFGAISFALISRLIV